MRFLSFRHGKEARFGAVVEDRVVDLSRHLSQYAGLKAVIAAGALVRARDIAAESSADFGLAEIEFLPTIPDPGKILCISHNYASRAPAREAHPRVFLRTRESFVGHDRPILKAPEFTQLDYEGEIAIVIGPGGRRIPAERAFEHVAGITLANDGTVRDWASHGGGNLAQCKNFAASGALGPWMVTPDELADPQRLALVTRVNGEVRQEDDTANLRFDFRRLIAYLSTFTPLEPGDLILTGSPAGGGVERSPPAFLEAGDIVEVEVAGIGVLRNPIAEEPRCE